MSRVSTRCRTIATLGLGLLLCGCTGEDAPESQVTAPSPDRQPLKERTADKPKPAIVAKTPSYSPPYPQRVDLFTPPKKANSVTRRSQGPGDEAVELVGFVSVDKPKAVLSIEGVVMSLSAGGKKYGIEVISVEPPKVVLQRGRSRWTASLE